MNYRFSRNELGLKKPMLPFKSRALMMLAGELTGYRLVTGKEPGCVIVNFPMWQAITVDLCNSIFESWPTQMKMALVNSDGVTSLDLFGVTIMLGFASEKLVKDRKPMHTLSTEQYDQIMSGVPRELDS